MSRPRQYPAPTQRSPVPRHRPAAFVPCSVLDWGLRWALGAALLLAAATPVPAQFNGDFGIHKDVLDVENFLDWKAYQHPYPWRYARYTAPNYIDGSVGSLSQQTFYLFEELRLEKDLGRYGSVLYFQQEDSFFRHEPIYQEIELRLGRGVYGSIVGFPQHDKINGSQGVALAYGERTDWNTVRLTHLRQYALFNEQGTGPQRFARAPELDRLEARAFWHERVFVQLNWREERPTELLTPDAVDPTQGLRQRYAGRKLGLVLDVHWSERLLTGISLRRQHERRERDPLDASSAISAARQDLELSWSNAYAVVTLAGGSVIEAGAYHGAFRNHIAADDVAERFDHHLLTDAAYVLWTLPRGEGFRWLFSLQLGRADLATMDGAAPQDDIAERSNQGKAGVGVVLHEAGSSFIFFNTTWDLDIFTHRQWDGGNIQLLFLF